jgi:serine/threonine protein kinase
LIVALLAGTRLGPYEILAPLGAGGMGEVYRARDSRLSREVAIKVLPTELSSDVERLKRFEKEARSASSLNHPNIVSVYDIGESRGTYFIAMELVGGQTLRKMLNEGALPTKRLLTVAAQMADGLAKAHSAGIVHRDLKPENVMVTKDGFVKILDFGLAKLTQREDGSAVTKSPTVSAGTGPGIVMGTVGYMSPEQALGKALDFQSDQFSFGSILYEMATGKRAFARDNAPETLTAIIREEPEPLSAAAPSTPAPLRWVVERCLAKEPEERYASTSDLGRELRTIRDHLSEATLGAATSVAERSARKVSRLWLLAAILGTGFAVWRLTRSSAATPTITLRPTNTATVTRIATPTRTRALKAAARIAPSHTATMTPSRSATSTETVTPSASSTPTPSKTPTATPAVTLTVAPATLNSPLAPVQVVLNPARLEETCKFIKTEEVYDPPGPKSLMSAIKDAVRKAGGNTVLVGPKQSEFMTEHATIEIYLCPETPQPSPTQKPRRG